MLLATYKATTYYSFLLLSTPLSFRHLPYSRGEVTMRSECAMRTIHEQTEWLLLTSSRGAPRSGEGYETLTIGSFRNRADALSIPLPRGHLPYYRGEVAMRSECAMKTVRGQTEWLLLT